MNKDSNAADRLTHLYMYNVLFCVWRLYVDEHRKTESLVIRYASTDGLRVSRDTVV